MHFAATAGTRRRSILLVCTEMVACSATSPRRRRWNAPIASRPVTMRWVSIHFFYDTSINPGKTCVLGFRNDIGRSASLAPGSQPDRPPSPTCVGPEALADPEEELPSSTGQDLQPLGGVCGQPEERESTVEALQLPEWTGALPIKTYGKSRVPPIHICK